MGRGRRNAVARRARPAAAQRWADRWEGAVSGAHGERHCRTASRAEGRNMIDGVVGYGDLLQGLPLVTLLAARGPVRWSAQAFGPRRPRRLIEPVARRWLAAVGTIQSEPALKFRKTRFQSRDLGRR